MDTNPLLPSDNKTVLNQFLAESTFLKKESFLASLESKLEHLGTYPTENDEGVWYGWNVGDESNEEEALYTIFVLKSAQHSGFILLNRMSGFRNLEYIFDEVLLSVSMDSLIGTTLSDLCPKFLFIGCNYLPDSSEGAKIRTVNQNLEYHWIYPVYT